MSKDLCKTCAYREGCETFSEPYNRLRSIICALAGLPFYCHQGMDWRTINLAELTRDQIIQFRKDATICEGWRQAVAARAKAGHHTLSKLRRRLGARAIRLINEIIKSEEPEKTRAYSDLEQTIELLSNAPEVSDSPATIRGRGNLPGSGAPEQRTSLSTVHSDRI
jgi:hypothetical protein